MIRLIIITSALSSSADEHIFYIWWHTDWLMGGGEGDEGVSGKVAGGC